MSWVSQADIKAIMTAIRNKFTTGDLVIANDAKDTGVELNYASQDGLVTVSPISTSASTEAALHLSNGDDTKKTELTQGTLSYVTGSGDSETYNYMSLLGDGVTFGKNGGGNVQLGGVADPTSAHQVATKNYVDSKSGTSVKYASFSFSLTSDKSLPASSLTYLGSVTPAVYETKIIGAHIYSTGSVTGVNLCSMGSTNVVSIFAYNTTTSTKTYSASYKITGIMYYL